MLKADAVCIRPPAVEVLPRETPSVISIDQLSVHLPNGEPLVNAENIVLSPGERVLVTGPSGAGKSTLFRALTGIWPFGSGHVGVPDGARVMLVPQRPYFPVATLAAAVGYPARADVFDDKAVAQAIAAVGLPELVSRLHEEAHWNRMLSLGEQQRLAIARALLHAPDYLFLDESTASLDEPSEAALYHLLQERLKHSTIISIGHRSTLRAFHRRHLEVDTGGAMSEVREAPLASAAE